MAEFPQSVVENLNQYTEQFETQVTNSTSGTRISKTPQDVQIITLAEKGVVVELPRKSCAHGHSFILQIKFMTHDGPTQQECGALNIQVTGVVEEVIGDTNERFQARIEFRQYSIEDWQRFLKHVDQRQEHANRLLAEMKK